LVIDEPVGFGAFARTVSWLLRVDPPAAARNARDLAQGEEIYAGRHLR
jgi:hypothetical protein